MSKRHHEPVRAPSDANGEDNRIFDPMPSFKIPKLAAVVCSSAPEGAQIGKDEAPASSNPAHHVPSPPARDSHTGKMSPPPPGFRNRSYFPPRRQIPPRRPIPPKPSRSASSSSSSSSSTSVRSPPTSVPPSRFPPSLRSADLATSSPSPYPLQFHASMPSEQLRTLWVLRARTYNTAALLSTAQAELAAPVEVPPPMALWLRETKAQMSSVQAELLRLTGALFSLPPPPEVCNQLPKN